MIFACVFNGDAYPEESVRRLQRMVYRNYWHRYTFVCISDRHIEGAGCLPMQAPLTGWWAKMLLFHPSTFPLEMQMQRIVYFDLDVIIHGILTREVDGWSDPFMICRDFQGGGTDNVNSSIMSFFPYQSWYIWNEWMKQGCPMPRAGDQQVIRDITQGRRQYFRKDFAWSYRFNERPATGKVCVFHGKPKPWDVPDDPIVKEGWR